MSTNNERRERRTTTTAAAKTKPIGQERNLKTTTKNERAPATGGVRATSWRNKWQSSSLAALTKLHLFTGQQWIVAAPTIDNDAADNDDDNDSSRAGATTTTPRVCLLANDDNDGDRKERQANREPKDTRESNQMAACLLPIEAHDQLADDQIKPAAGRNSKNCDSMKEEERSVCEKKQKHYERNSAKKPPNQYKINLIPNQARNEIKHHHEQQQQKHCCAASRGCPELLATSGQLQSPKLVNCCESKKRTNCRNRQQCRPAKHCRSARGRQTEFLDGSKECDCRKAEAMRVSVETNAHDGINQLKLVCKRCENGARREVERVARWPVQTSATYLYTGESEAKLLEADLAALRSESAADCCIAAAGENKGKVRMSIRRQRRGRRRSRKRADSQGSEIEPDSKEEVGLVAEHSKGKRRGSNDDGRPKNSTHRASCVKLFRFRKKGCPAMSQPRSIGTNSAILFAILIFIYIIITSNSSTHYKVAATNYWPLRRHNSNNNNNHYNNNNNRQRYQQAAADRAPKTGGPLLIGQHYNNYSSIVPYSIVQDSDYAGGSEVVGLGGLDSPMIEDQLVEEQQESEQVSAGQYQGATRSDMSYERDEAKSRALLPLDSNRLILPQMQQIKSRFNQGCVGGTKCQFFAFCWMSGGSLGASCGLLMTCCVTPSRQEIQPGFYGPVVNDPYCGRSTSKINRIVGGTDASFGQFPWQAFVQVGGSRCGGALISSRHVVTAGHCVARSQHSPSSIKVTLGDYILNSDIESIPHEVFSVVEVLLHPNFRFTPQADRYDVAVLELDRTASYKDNIKPICLPQKDAAFVGRVAYVAGWGALQAGSKLRPKVLQHVAVPVIENHVCESWHRRKGIDIRIYDEMMCAGYELGQRDACQGDSGGPLMLNQFGVWYLVGIVSAGYSCAKQYQPGIYHRVSSSSDWISSNVYQQGSSK